MDDLTALQKTVTRITFFFLSICFLGWALLPTYAPYFSGLAIGILASLLNYTFLAWKVRRFTDAIVKKTNRRMTLGFITRAAIALLAVVITLKYKEVNVIATIVGLLFTQLVTLVWGIRVSQQNKK